MENETRKNYTGPLRRNTPAGSELCELLRPVLVDATFGTDPPTKKTWQSWEKHVESQF